MRVRLLVAIAAISIASAARADDAGTDAGIAESDAAARALVSEAVSGNGATKKKNEAELVKMGEAAVPALIVGAKKSPGDENKKWCEDVLDEMGKRTAADQVQTKTDDALIAVFHAFLEIHDVDTLGAILPFVGADRIAIRQAARDTIVGFGDSATSRVRAEYINLGGALPSNGNVTFRELDDAFFTLRDQLRLKDTVAMFDQGLALAKTDLPAGVADLDSAIAREPLLERRAEAAPIYMQYARSLEPTDREKARAYDSKVTRIAKSDAPEISQAESELAFFDAEDLRASGIVDRNAYARAAELDPSNEEAKAALSKIDADRADSDARAHKTIAAIVAAFAMTAALVFGFFVHRRRKSAD
ncbi:MAG: hypothetical protein ACRELY_25610 [Polyangiaceae bacterium]